MFDIVYIAGIAKKPATVVIRTALESLRLKPASVVIAMVTWDLTVALIMKKHPGQLA
jgi:predicted HAD superfamily phosphohydrolase YqeG